MKAGLLLFVLFIALSASGCKSAANSSEYNVVDIEPIAPENALIGYTTHHTNIQYGGVDNVFGQSIQLDLKKEEFDSIPKSDFVEFIMKCSNTNDNVIIAFDDNTAIVFSNTYKYGKYGTWDLDSGLTKIVGEFNLDEDECFVYKELAAPAKEDE